MDYSKPTLLIISGPNGAGKSTHIQTMLPDSFKGIVSFDRDKTRIEFERQLIFEGTEPTNIRERSALLMEAKLLTEMKKAISLKNHFVLETPLSHPDYWKYIDLFEINNYQLQLNYLCLDKISDCMARVGQRVLEGGHFVEPNIIKGVYQKNLEYINDYIDTFNAVELYDGMRIPILLVKTDGNSILYASAKSLTKSWIKKGLPKLSAKIQIFLSIR